MDLAPKGIVNLGNTCYVNSCIQILSHIPKFINACMRENVRHPTKVEVNLWNNWINILKIIQSGNSNEMIHPNGFIRSIIQVTEHKKGFSFSENEPGDANEFILFMIETLHMCVCQMLWDL